LFIGTEGGFIEHWSIEKNILVNTYESHPGASLGVSSIIEINSQSYLLWGNYSGSDPAERQQYKLIASAAYGSPEIKIWKFFNGEDL
jgi:hypothetical protein